MISTPNRAHHTFLFFPPRQVCHQTIATPSIFDTARASSLLAGRLAQPSSMMELQSYRLQCLPQGASLASSVARHRPRGDSHLSPEGRKRGVSPRGRARSPSKSHIWCERSLAYSAVVFTEEGFYTPVATHHPGGWHRVKAALCHFKSRECGVPFLRVEMYEDRGQNLQACLSVGWTSPSFSFGGHRPPREPRADACL